MTGKERLDLAAVCAALADELDEVSVTTDGATTVYARDGAEFARVTGASLSVRLPVEIAAAALRTPDTTPDPTDRGWLTFSPTRDATDVRDRARAWFHTAWRHANDH
jgi:hypothetical protein